MSKIWPGAFFDRFMPYKLGVLANPDPTIQAAIVDCSVRQYIDLVGRRSELVQLIEHIGSVTGFPLDAATILDTPATEDELWSVAGSGGGGSTTAGSYFIAYDKDKGNLLMAVSEYPITPAHSNVGVVRREGPLPVLSEVEWNPANLYFYKDGVIVA